MPNLSFAKAYWLAVGATFAVAAVLGLIGSIPATQWYGPKAGATVIVGCLVSWLTSCVGAIPLAAGLTKSPNKQAEAILGATALRFMTALVLILPLLLSGWFDRATFIVAFMLSYLVLLLVDTVVVVQLMRRWGGGSK